MNPENNYLKESEPDVAARILAGLREEHRKGSTRFQCPENNCTWTGHASIRLQEHLREEHGQNVSEQQLVQSSSVPVERQTQAPHFKPEEPMNIDSNIRQQSSPSRPARRRFGSGTGRKVSEAPPDPDFHRGGPQGRDAQSGPARTLYNPATDGVAQNTSARLPPSQRGLHQGKGASTSPIAPRPRAPIQPQRVPIAPNVVPIQPQVGAPNLIRKAPVASPTTPVYTQHAPLHHGDEPEPPDLQPELILQPETRPISQEQLVAEVKGIYAGLVMVEAKCIEVDSKQAAAATQNAKDGPRLNNEQWQALIALHRTLLHEHHDFFLASQHPSAAPSLRKLASKYAMPARMWRHGIHSFLELLRHRLPHSFEHMLAFIYLAYSMMALLYETVPAFADTWVECLGDLGRYRMAIEEDARDREVWMNVSRFWYSKGTDRLPQVGRLYHHLAILARPNILQQLFYYCKALVVYQPFSAARESILTLFDPAALKDQDIEGTQSADATFVLLHSICFNSVNAGQFAEKKEEYLELLEKKVTISKNKFKIAGVHIAICGVASLFQYNMKSCRLKSVTLERENQKATHEAEAAWTRAQATKPEPDNSLPPGPIVDGYIPAQALSTPAPELDLSEGTDIRFKYASELSFSILARLLDRDNEMSTQPHIHVWCVFLNYLKEYPEGMALIVKDFPWSRLAKYATALLKKRKSDEVALARINDTSIFPMVQKGFRPLPEEYLLRGLEITRRYFPFGYFSRNPIDDDERLLELPSMNFVREEKILWLLIRFANYGPWLNYDPVKMTFSVSPELKAVLQPTIQKTSYANKPNTAYADSDVDMNDSPNEESESSVDDIDNPELAQLLTQRNNLRRKLDDPAIAIKQENGPTSPATFSADSFRPNYTTVVVDTNSLLKNLGTFKNMLDSNHWQVVLPYAVVTELRGLQRNDGMVSETSVAALNVLEAALQEKRNLRILTAKGSPINNLSSNFKELIDDYALDGRRNLDDIIIETAKAQGELTMSTKRLSSSSDQGYVRPVVLITDDQIMRVKANTRGVASLATKQWIRIISGQESKGQMSTELRIADAYASYLAKNPGADKDEAFKIATNAVRKDKAKAHVAKAQRQAQQQQQFGV